MKMPQDWYSVYPHGTKEGDEELKFFIALSRNPKYQWRSTSALSKETGLTRERVEEIINKYYKKGMVFQNPKNEDQWSYWSRTPEMLPKMQKSISQKDQDDRIKKLNKDCSQDDCSCDKIDLKADKFDCMYNVFYIDTKFLLDEDKEKLMQQIGKAFRKQRSFIC